MNNNLTDNLSNDSPILSNSLSDSEIIKALECCAKAKLNDDCRKLKCPFFDDAIDMCGVLNSEQVLIANALDLINRQQAEIERLKNILICFMGALGKVRNIDDIESISQIPLMTELNKGIRAEIKAEAYKECIDKIQNQIKNNNAISAEWLRKYLDNLLKELSGEYKPPKTETQIKFEAYCECIEKIKQRAEYCSYSVAVNTIADNVLKDLEGENKCE